MASRETWDKVSLFFRRDSRIDKWGDPDAIQDDHLLRLFDFRSYLGLPIYVTSGVRRGEGGSFHLRENGACATDIVIPSYGGTAVDLIFDATRFGFRGIGYYPHWSFKSSRCGGLHLDSRPLKWHSDETLNYAHSRWICVKGKRGELSYLAMTFDNLLRFG